MGTNELEHFYLSGFWRKINTGLKKNGEVKIKNNGLTALALLVAQNNPEEKELMIKLVINLTNG